MSFEVRSLADVDQGVVINAPKLRSCHEFEVRQGNVNLVKSVFPMARIAYLGPEYTFSHDLVRTHFKKDTGVPVQLLAEVVKLVARGDCQAGVVPFYNTTKRSIQESLQTLIRFQKKVWVTDVIARDVKHYLCGFCDDISSISTIRSKGVVFYQASEWLTKHLPRAGREDHWQSTAEAVKSLKDKTQSNVAAIGSKSACKGYGVPIIKSNIQNKPNRTSFFLIEGAEPDDKRTKRTLFCLPKASESSKRRINEIVTECRCPISSNWIHEMSKENEAYFFELDGEYCKLDQLSAIGELKHAFRKIFNVGSYNACITSLIFPPDGGK